MKSICLAALLLASTVSAHSAGCTIEQVTYTQTEAEGFTLTFRPAKEPNAWSNLEATLKTPTREFKFSMTASNGYSFNYLVPSWPGVSDDTSFSVHLYDKDFKTLELPNKGVPAPVAILTPELGTWLYYSENTANPDIQEFLPADMWRPGTCG